MAASVGDSWGRIVRWLERNVPAVGAQINPPAMDAEIDALTADVGIALPADLTAWWRLADGKDWPGGLHPGHLLPPWFDQLTVAYARKHRRMLVEVEESCGDPDDLADAVVEPAGSPALAWLPTSVPFASDFGGIDLFVDLRPGPAHGCVTTHDKVFASEAGMVWPSVAAMLAEVADAMETGGVSNGARPLVRDGRLSWELV